MIDLRFLNDNEPAPDPLPWWIRNSDLIAMALCLCIWIAWGIGEWRLSHG